MPDRKRTGQRGEEAAAAFLESRGCRILERNWRCGRSEIDLIAMDGETLVFVEVKTRTSGAFGRPARYIPKAQLERIGSTAGAYMEHIQHDWALRFDVISVIFHPNGNVEVEHIEDAFFPGLF